MSVSPPSGSKVPAEEFAEHCNGQVIPANKSLSYFSVVPLEDDELQRLVYDPAAAVPPGIRKVVPDLRLVLVAYLEKANEKNGSSGASVISQSAGAARRLYSTRVVAEGLPFIFVAVKDEDIADTHDAFYQELAALLVDRMEKVHRSSFEGLLREELRAEVRGEIEESSWKLKEALLSRQSDPCRDTKLAREYFGQAMADTLTLYLHGLCCDIDVESGPRQLASRYIRKRLDLLRQILPPPKGVALYPEELPAEL